MRRSYKQRSYRGTSKVQMFLKGLIVVLTLVLLVSIGGYFWLQQYVVYTDDGVQLMLPWEQEEPAVTLSPSTSISDGSAIPSATPTPVIEVVPAEIPEEPLQAITLSLDTIYNGTVGDLLAEQGASAALFDMKLDDGTLAYVSAIDLAIQAQASAGEPAINTAIQAYNQEEGSYTIARVSCFKDNLLSNTDYSLNILTNSGYRWTDPEGLRWSSPTDQRVQDYLVEICLELAELGFDEILLDNAAYPNEGNLHYIKIGDNYNASEFATVIDGFYSQVASALAVYPDVKLSVTTTADTLNLGEDSLSGQTVDSLISNAQRIWVADLGASWSTTVDQLTREGMEEASLNLVSIVDEAGSSTRSWAVWPVG